MIFHHTKNHVSVTPITPKKGSQKCLYTAIIYALYMHVVIFKCKNPKIFFLFLDLLEENRGCPRLSKQF